jgi:hypothetical protein
MYSRCINQDAQFPSVILCYFWLNRDHGLSRGGKINDT